MSGRYQHSMCIGDQNKRMTPERVALRFLSSFQSKTYRVVVRHKAIAAGLQTFSTSVPGSVQRQEDSKDPQSDR